MSLKYTPHFVSASPNYTSWEFSASCTLQTNRTADQFSSAAAVNSLCKPHCASFYQIQIRRNEEEAVLMEAGSNLLKQKAQDCTSATSFTCCREKKAVNSPSKLISLGLIPTAGFLLPKQAALNTRHGIKLHLRHNTSRLHRGDQ